MNICQRIQSGQVASPVLRELSKGKQRFLSPMNFLPCPRGPGRPKKNIRQGAPSIPVAKKRKSSAIDFLTEESIFSASPAILRQYEVLPEPKKKQGRPAGSMNKEKEI